MRLEYFQLIDRIVDINLDDQTIRVEATVPTHPRSSKTTFRLPADAVCCSSKPWPRPRGWLVIAATKFHPHADLSPQ